MAKRGHDITVFTTSATSEYVVEEHDNIRIYRYGTDLRIGTSNISWGQFRVSIDRSFDLIHTHFDLAPGPLAGLRYAKSAHLPLIITYHGDWVDDYGGIIRRLGVTMFNRHLVDKILSHASVIISPSTTNIERSRFLKPHENKIVVIPNGIDLQDFVTWKIDMNKSKYSKNNYDISTNMSKKLNEQKDLISLSKYECRTLLNLPLDTEILLYMGALYPHKGPRVLIMAMVLLVKRYPRILLLIGGKGPIEDELKDLVETTNLQKNVRFIGFVTGESKALYYKASDLFVLPSLSESFGIVNLEAMASGLPIVASNVGGTPDVVKDGINGLLVIPGDPEDLAKKILCLLNSESLREKLGNAGKILSKEYSWEKIADKTEQVYLDLI